MSSFDYDIEDTQFTIHFNYTPPEMPGWNYPGACEEIEITHIVFNGVILTDYIFNLIMKDYGEDIELKCWDYIEQERKDAQSDWAEQKYDREHDFFHLLGQDNVLRYLPVGRVAVRVQPQDSLFETLARIAATRISGCRAVVSLHEGAKSRVVEFLQGSAGRALLSGSKVLRQSDEELAAMIPAIHRIRYAGPERVSEAVMAEAARYGFYIARTPVYMDGRLELLQYYRQQSVCNNYHRYGNLGDRSMDEEIRA